MITPIIKRITPIFGMKEILATIFFSLATTGCQKNINLLIPTAPSQVVVEGYIENGKHPYVMLTRNAPFLGTIDSSQLASYIVTNAIVTVSNGTFTDTLRLTIDPTLPVPIAYETTNMIGQVN